MAGSKWIDALALAKSWHRRAARDHGLVSDWTPRLREYNASFARTRRGPAPSCILRPHQAPTALMVVIDPRSGQGGTTSHYRSLTTQSIHRLIASSQDGRGMIKVSRTATPVQRMSRGAKAFRDGIAMSSRRVQSGT